MNSFCVAFGELEISPLIFSIMIFLTLFIFAAVAISSIKLIQSLVKPED